MFSLVLKMGDKNHHKNIYSEDLDSPHREVFIRGIGFIVALLVFWQIDFRVRVLGSNPDVRDT